MSVEKFRKNMTIIKEKYEDSLTEIRYNLLKNPGEKKRIVELLEVLNNASDDVINCMEMASRLDTPTERKECLDMLEEFLPEYFYFIEVEDSYRRRHTDTQSRREKEDLQ